MLNLDAKVCFGWRRGNKGKRKWEYWRPIYDKKNLKNGRDSKWQSIIWVHWILSWNSSLFSSPALFIKSLCLLLLMPPIWSFVFIPFIFRKMVISAVSAYWPWRIVQMKVWRIEWHIFIFVFWANKIKDVTYSKYLSNLTGRVLVGLLIKKCENIYWNTNIIS